MKSVSFRALMKYIIPSFNNFPTLNEANLYIDGPQLILGLLGIFKSEPPSEDTSVNDRFIIDVCNRRLDHIKNKFEKHKIKIITIYVIFDGIKINKQTKQRKKQLIFNYGNVKKEIGKNMKHVKVIYLDHGEAEVALFHDRDVKRPSILISNDADLLVITAGYKKETENDDVYIYTMDTKTFYNPSKINCNISPDVLKILFLLIGSDFTPQIISQNIFYLVLKYGQKYNLKDFNISSISHLEILLGTIYEICIRFNLPIINHISLNSSEELKNIIWWTFCYLKTGIFVKKSFSINHSKTIDYMGFFKNYKLSNSYKRLYL